MLPAAGIIMIAWWWTSKEDQSWHDHPETTRLGLPCVPVPLIPQTTPKGRQAWSFVHGAMERTKDPSVDPFGKARLPEGQAALIQLPLLDRI